MAGLDIPSPSSVRISLSRLVSVPRFRGLVRVARGAERAEQRGCRVSVPCRAEFLEGSESDPCLGDRGVAVAAGEGMGQQHPCSRAIRRASGAHRTSPVRSRGRGAPPDAPGVRCRPMARLRYAAATPTSSSAGRAAPSAGRRRLRLARTSSRIARSMWSSSRPCMRRRTSDATTVGSPAIRCSRARASVVAG